MVNLISEENQYDNIVTLGKDVVDDIRSKNNKLDKLLRSYVFDIDGVYYKGGVARLAMDIYVNGYSDDIIRDVDLCYVGKSYGDITPLSRGDIDFEGDDLRAYFDSRDVTLNEVLLSKDKLIFTRRCYRDYVKGSVNARGNELTTRLFARMLLFSIRYNYSMPPYISLVDHREFELLICLLKAYELGIEDKFFQGCRLMDLTVGNSVVDWLYDLLGGFYGFDLMGREGIIAKDVSVMSDEQIEHLYDLHPELRVAVEKISDSNLRDYSKYFTKPNRANKYNV